LLDGCRQRLLFLHAQGRGFWVLPTNLAAGRREGRPRSTDRAGHVARASVAAADRSRASGADGPAGGRSLARPAGARYEVVIGRAGLWRPTHIYTLRPFPRSVERSSNLRAEEILDPTARLRGGCVAEAGQARATSAAARQIRLDGRTTPSDVLTRACPGVAPSARLRAERRRGRPAGCRGVQRRAASCPPGRSQQRAGARETLEMEPTERAGRDAGRGLALSGSGPVRVDNSDGAALQKRA